jgi:hypothetical protein
MVSIESDHLPAEAFGGMSVAIGGTAQGGETNVTCGRDHQVASQGGRFPLPMGGND